MMVTDLHTPFKSSCVQIFRRMRAACPEGSDVLELNAFTQPVAPGASELDDSAGSLHDEAAGVVANPVLLVPLLICVPGGDSSDQLTDSNVIDDVFLTMMV